MISLKEYQDALKIVEEYRKQQYKINYFNNINSEIYAETDINDIGLLYKSGVIHCLCTIAHYELGMSKNGKIPLKSFSGLSRDTLLRYRNFGKRKLEILEHHLSLAGLHLEP